MAANRPKTTTQVTENQQAARIAEHERVFREHESAIDAGAAAAKQRAAQSGNPFQRIVQPDVAAFEQRMAEHVAEIIIKHAPPSGGPKR